MPQMIGEPVSFLIRHGNVSSRRNRKISSGVSLMARLSSFNTTLSSGFQKLYQGSQHPNICQRRLMFHVLEQNTLRTAMMGHTPIKVYNGGERMLMKEDLKEPHIWK